MAERISNPVEQRLILKDGRTLGFAEYGDPKGEPMLEFHGCPSSRLEARNYDEAGQKLGVRVLGVDRPGFGISTFVKGYRIVDWPADVIEFADALGLSGFSVAGISAGSPYALACARFIPERLKGCTVVSGLPPLTVVKREKLERKQFFMGEEFLIARLANDVPFVAGAIFRYFLWQLRKDPSHAIDGIPTATPHDIELLKRPEMGRVYQQMIIEAFRNGVRGPVQGMGLYLREWGFSLSDITMQVNIWHEELLFPASAKFVASKLPNHKLHMIPNVGHITLVVERAEDVLRELLAAN